MLKANFIVAFCLLASLPISALASSSPSADKESLQSGTFKRFAKLAISCVHREYPNKISHVMASADDVAAPSDLTPAFYGCFDWHSAVHGHWLLARLLKKNLDAPLKASIETALGQSFSQANLQAELAYFTAPQRGSFERPYGLAWYLQLVAELAESNKPLHQKWRKTLRPLEDAIVEKVSVWLPKLAYPVRLGTHNQTAFAFGLMLDYARTVGNVEFEALLKDKVLGFHKADIDCPMAYEPSGEDFLSPCLMEADLMRRVIGTADYSRWLDTFLPAIPTDGSGIWLAPAIVLDASDGKLVHLDGVNLSRAWALEGIASALPKSDARRGSLLAAAEIHKKLGIKSVSAEHYEGSHWLASFATYLLTKRGIK